MQRRRLVISEAELGTPRVRRSRRRIVVAGTLLATLALLALLSELLLPSIAETRLRDSLEANGANVHVHVEAEPAVKLLFGYADRVTVHIGVLHSGRGSLADRLAGTEHVARLDATVATLFTHGLALHQVWLRKRKKVLSAGAAVRRRSVVAILPRHVRITERGAGANRLAFTATLRVLGHVARAKVLVEAEDGRLLLHPASPVAGFLHITLFDDPRVLIDSIGSRRVQHGDYVFTARGHLK